MGLTFTPKIEELKFPGGSITVRGLSLEDFTVLLREHYAPIAALFDRYVAEATAKKIDEEEAGGALNLGDLQSVVLEALQVAPGLIGDVIARAADETEEPHKTRLLPVGFQITVIEKIVKLTLEAEGGLEKLVETVSRLADSLVSLPPNQSQ